MTDIFISYRREDSAGHTGRLFDRLTEHFGKDHVFMDIADIEPGVDFVEAIDRALDSCDVFAVVIGRQWLNVTDATGRRRIDDPEDFIRLEIANALRRDIRVIPVLVQGAAMPGAASLPEDLRNLSRRQGHELSENRWDYDVGRLIGTLETAPEGNLAGEGKVPSGPPLPRKLPRWVMTVVAGVLLIGAGMATLLLQSQKGIEVPNVVGRPVEQAEQMLAKRNLSVEVIRRVQTEAESPGMVLAQQPAPGDRVAKRRKVDLEVAVKPEPTPAPSMSVPDVASKSGADEQHSKPARQAAAAKKIINLLAPENGGQLLLVPSDQWLATIDGKEDYFYIEGEAVYAFKDEMQATFDTFKVLIAATQRYNLKEFELLIGNDSPTGRFESIGKFQTQNIKFVKQPYQEFKFPAVTARYLRVKVLSSHSGSEGNALAYEFQLLGTLN